MSKKSLTYIDPLSLQVNEDGSVDLEQDLGSGNVERVFLHRLHVRLILEETGHLLKQPLEGELVGHLLQGLCEFRREITACAADNRPEDLNGLRSRIDGFWNSLPEYLISGGHDKHTNQPDQAPRPGFDLV